MDLLWDHILITVVSVDFSLLQALMVVAHKSSTEEIGILRKLFQKYDTRSDGSIGYEEFCGAMSEFGHSEDDLLSMFESAVSAGARVHGMLP